ncbi:MAG: metallophosphoesterase [Gemmatimonadota bacterium]
MSAPLRSLAGALLCALWPAAAQAQARVVAVGDVHGDVEQLRRVLRGAALVDDGDRWSGGQDALVVVGDFVDRGPASRAVLDLLMSLEEDSGGRVQALLGNHEVLTLIGDARYVSPQDYAAFADSASASLREERYRSYLTFLGARAARLGFEEPPAGAARRDAWMEAHPAGFFERRRAFGAEGRYGRWLRGRDAASVIDGTLFLHAGPSATRRFPALADLNAEVRREIADFDDRWSELVTAGVLWPDLTWSEALQLVAEELDLWSAVDSLPPGRVDPAALRGRPDAATLARMGELTRSEDWTITAPDGPLWYRGLAQEPEADLTPWLEGALEAYGARRVVVGHTPTPDGRIAVRAGGRIVLVDTGISAAVRGAPSALELTPDGLVALYPGSPPERLSAKTGYDAFLGLSPEAIEKFLREAAIVAAAPLSRGVTKPWKATLDDGRLRHAAAVQTVDACTKRGGEGRGFERVCDSWKYNVAAFELAKLLGLRAVVPSVERPFQGRRGAFTWWVEDVMTFDEMKQSGANPPDGASWNRQQWRIGIFDELIYNTDRNQGNLLVDPTWHVWLIDHSRAFREAPRPRNPGMLARMKLDASLLDGLRGLTPSALERCCAEYLTSREQEALLARRDTILVRLAEDGTGR